jgi:hypothetical protein
MADIQPETDTERAYAEFISSAQELVQTRAVAYMVDKPWGGGNEPLVIPDGTYAYDAALLMRQERRTWLQINDARGQCIGFVNTHSLREVLELLDASPWLGEEMMAEILQPLEMQTRPVVGSSL